MIPLMIPMTATVTIHNPRVRRFQLWIPLFLVWILLLPFALLLLPFFVVLCWIVRVQAWPMVVSLGMLLIGLRGTHIQAGDHQSQVVVDIP